MYLKQIRLQHIACFSNTTLDFTREETPCPWVVLVGENSSGKSTPKNKLNRVSTLATANRVARQAVCHGSREQRKTGSQAGIDFTPGEDYNPR